MVILVITVILRLNLKTDAKMYNKGNNGNIGDDLTDELN